VKSQSLSKIKVTTQQLFATDQCHRRQKKGIEKLRQIFLRTADADEALDPRVIGRKLGVANGPVIAITVAAGGFEFIIAQPGC